MAAVSNEEFLQYTLLSKNVLSLEEQELYEVSQLAGVILDPSVFKIIMDLLKMNVAPQAILQVLRSISGQRPKKVSSPEVSQRTHQTEADRRVKSRGRVPSGRKTEARR
ncbi:mitotic-spindle organizing protein 2-like [Crassostrea virginica]|uniref:Mitotic-spindle organizing protein 2-like n=1 Tax=Crassostrea virginica TaxID=6565 RepID=A0A8B8EKZ1_CRAVI|nr:mitotic-spindle organizing protein 2-like [Crassostrea virginica]XP_022340472.1 mitotic-spindle organizing protein 2-like [Crassostrea virginica]